MLCWPNALAITPSGDIEILFTYTASDDVEDAHKQIKFWEENDNIILSWWINDSDSNTIEQGLCFNNAGQLVNLDGVRIPTHKKVVDA